MARKQLRQAETAEARENLKLTEAAAAAMNWLQHAISGKEPETPFPEETLFNNSLCYPFSMITMNKRHQDNTTPKTALLFANERKGDETNKSARSAYNSEEYLRQAKAAKITEFRRNLRLVPQNN
jgi:hypothetical protein